MKIKSEKTYAIVGTSILDINNKEMKQMHELNNRIKNVLDSHKEGSEKREYISDDDLKLMHAILSIFTKEYADTQTSAFDEFLKEQDNPTKNHGEDNPVEENETLIKGGPGEYPVDRPIAGESICF